jgi:hypothetical protein
MTFLAWFSVIARISSGFGLIGFQLCVAFSFAEQP